MCIEEWVFSSSPFYIVAVQSYKQYIDFFCVAHPSVCVCVSVVEWKRDGIKKLMVNWWVWGDANNNKPKEKETKSTTTEDKQVITQSISNYSQRIYSRNDQFVAQDRLDIRCVCTRTGAPPRTHETIDFIVNRSFLFGKCSIEVFGVFFFRSLSFARLHIPIDFRWGIPRI